MDVASSHHQGPNRLGKGLRAVAWAEDDTVEALEADGHPALLAVQWHPEETADRDPTQQRLFDWLVAQAQPELPCNAT
jgi:putative glutamine amidotransferase